MIAEAEGKLFKKWKSERDIKIFVEDGVINENSYITASPKILFLLKEANSKNEFSLKHFVANGGRSYTWNNIYRWCKCIKNPYDEHNWKDLQSVSNQDRISEFKDISVVNLKKDAGSGTTNNNELWNHLERDKDFIIEQTNLYNSDYIICCGSIVFWAYLFLYNIDEADCESTSRGIRYIIHNNRAVIDFCHPEARAANNFKYYALLDAIHEINGKL